MKVHYKANITTGALLVSESRKIAGLMIKGVSAEEWKKTIEVENILQKLSISSANRVAFFIKARLETMDFDLWKMVRDGDSTLTTQALFAAAIKHCRLLGDYLDTVVREQYKKMEDGLTPALWDEFIVSCKQRDPLMKDFPPTTAIKIRTTVHKILSEAGYLENQRQLKLKKIEIIPEIMYYLKNKNESYVLKCIQVSK